MPSHLNSRLVARYRESRNQFPLSHRGGKSFRKSLVQFARCLPGLRFKTAKLWVKRIVDKEFAEGCVIDGPDKFESIFS